MNNYQQALEEFAFIEKPLWLQKFKELYYKTLIHPKGLPAIARSGDFFDKHPKSYAFHTLYSKTLKEYLHIWDNENGVLILLE